MHENITNIKTQIFTPGQVIATARRYRDTKTQPWLDASLVEGFNSFVQKTYLYEFVLPGDTAREQGITHVNFVTGQPYTSKGYPSLREMHEGVQQTGALDISTDYADCWLLGATNNCLFRAIHDLHHLAEKARFDLDGETRAAVRMMKLTTSDLWRRIIFSEIIGQRCYYEVYGTYMDDQIVLIDLDGFIDFNWFKAQFGI